MDLYFQFIAWLFSLSALYQALDRYQTEVEQRADIDRKLDIGPIWKPSCYVLFITQSNLFR